MKEFNFTSARLQKLTNTSGKDEEYNDTSQPGLVLRLTKSDSKIFRLKAWNKHKRKMVQLVIGHFPQVKINDAREIAAKHLSDIAHGVDIAERIRKNREEETFEDVFNLWINDFAKAPEGKKTWEQDISRYNLYIADHLGKMQLSAITPDVLRGWRRKLTDKDKLKSKGKLSKTTINRAFSIISTVFTTCAPQMANPCSEVAKFKEKKLNTFLKSDELSRFFDTLNDRETPDYIRDYLLLSLYTGARRANVLAMRWENIDLNVKIWAIDGDEMKNTEPMVIPLLDQAVTILEERKAKASSPWVFPSPKSKTGHFVEPKKAWKSLLARAKLSPAYRLHDLRRTMGSWQAITGSSTKIIGASLGHKSEQATSHYAHLTIEPVRAAMQRAADAMDGHKLPPITAGKSSPPGDYTITILEQCFSINISTDENLLEAIEKEMVRRLEDGSGVIVVKND